MSEEKGFELPRSLYKDINGIGEKRLDEIMAVIKGFLSENEADEGGAS